MIVVEGKVDEDFGPTLEKWLSDPKMAQEGAALAEPVIQELVRFASYGKRQRWESLKLELNLPDDCPLGVRYQLVHRAASALIEARRFGARHAVVLIHSFSPTDNHLADFEEFVRLYDTSVDPGRAMQLATIGGIRLWAAWVRGDQRFREV